MTINFGKNVESQKMAVNGWNWGKASFGGRQMMKVELIIHDFVCFSW